tara:strand:- start:276 stop:533 length:258 start_codon:yes stop_codon:yes gene_type:complete
MKLEELNDTQLSSFLAGKTVRYTNTKKDSTVTGDRTRTFKINSIDRVGRHVETSNQFITAKVSDIDDSGAEKSRTLYVDSIDVIV